MRLEWPDCLNTRDVGGLRTASGGRVRLGALIRTDQLGRLTAAGVAALRSYGVRRVIDLRSAGEVADAPGPFANDPMYRHAPFIDEEADRRRDPVAESTMIATYRGSIDRNGRCIRAGIADVADAPAGGVVVHCASGKDRTGILVALMLRAAGVAVDEIAADYALTAESLRDQSCRPETMLGTLSYVDDRFGGPEQYLVSVGVTRKQLARLRARLVDG